ncbi:3-oxoacyl-ACP synthase [Chromatiales bacterium (ex Bugula neritina AB1)]|nr:3-oxoacyl-ACP synthase [Chromatiales bacterium (ex Bugula neritina AB1)]
MKYSRICGTGSYLPEKVIHNSDLEKRVNTTDAWIRERTGIVKRHIAADDETTLDLAEAAARQALDAAGLQSNDIDLIVVATTTPDCVFPSVACLLQQRLGVTNSSPAFDVQAVCAGFAYALSVADNFIRAGSSTTALVIGAETFSRILNWEDRNTCVLFGDGAGAVILEASNEPGVLSTHLHADGRYAELLHVPNGVSRGYDVVQQQEAFVQMRGNEVFRMAVRKLQEVVVETLAVNNLDKSEIDWLVPHQANIRIIAATAKKLDMGMEKVVVTVHDHGNTSAASIPLALDTAVRDGRIKRGEKLLLEGFGGGFTWGSALIQY